MNDRHPYDESPEHRSRIRDAIDACRPAPVGENIDDLNQPEVEFLAAHLKAHPEDRLLLEQVQQFDRQVRDQMANVAVPEGLAGRLLEKLDQAAEPDSMRKVGNALDEAVADDDLEHGDLRPLTREKRSLGRNLWIGIAVAATIAIAIPLTNWLRPTPALLKNDVYTAALEWVGNQKGGQPAALDKEEMEVLYRQFPLSDQVIGARNRAQLKFLGRDGVVYSLTSRGGLQAKLLVVKIEPARPDSDIPIGRPNDSPHGTMGFSLLVWQEEDDLLYVLIVPDDPAVHEPYKQFLDNDMPIARLHVSLAQFAKV